MLFSSFHAKLEKTPPGLKNRAKSTRLTEQRPDRHKCVRPLAPETHKSVHRAQIGLSFVRVQGLNCFSHRRRVHRSSDVMNNLSTGVRIRSFATTYLYVISNDKDLAFLFNYVLAK
jgi:hypothetical protein